MSEDTKKMLQVYRSEPSEDIQTLVGILNRDRDAEEFKLYVDQPNYDVLIQKIWNADQTVCWW